MKLAGQRSHNIILMTILFTLVAVIITLSIIILIAKLNPEPEPTTDQSDVNDVTMVEYDQLISDLPTDEPDPYADIINLPSELYINAMAQRIADAETNEQKAILHTDRANALLNRQDRGEGDFTDIILTDYLAAEELSPSLDTAVNLYFYYTELGDQTLADQYLQLAIDRGYNKDGAW